MDVRDKAALITGRASGLGAAAAEHLLAAGAFGELDVCLNCAGVVGTGPTATPDGPPLLADLPPEFLNYLNGLNAFPKRGGGPAEFAALVSNIVASPYLNGEVIRIDAGTRAPPRS